MAQEQEEFIIVGSDGVEHAFPIGMDPVKAGQIVRNSTPQKSNSPEDFSSGFNQALKDDKSFSGTVAGVTKGFVGKMIPGAIDSTVGILGLPKYIWDEVKLAAENTVGFAADPTGKMKETLEKYKAIPGQIGNAVKEALVLAGTDPQGFGEMMGHTTGGAMAGIATAKGVVRAPKPIIRNLGKLTETIGHKGNLAFRIAGAQQVAYGNPLGLATIVAPEMLTKSGKMMQRVGTNPGALVGTPAETFLQVGNDLSTGAKHPQVLLNQVDDRLKAIGVERLKAKLPEDIAILQKEQNQLDQLRGRIKKQINTNPPPPPGGGGGGGGSPAPMSGPKPPTAQEVAIRKQLSTQGLQPAQIEDLVQQELNGGVPAGRVRFTPPKASAAPTTSIDPMTIEAPYDGPLAGASKLGHPMSVAHRESEFAINNEVFKRVRAGLPARAPAPAIRPTPRLNPDILEGFKRPDMNPLARTQAEQAAGNAAVQSELAGTSAGVTQSAQSTPISNIGRELTNPAPISEMPPGISGLPPIEENILNRTLGINQGIKVTGVKPAGLEALRTEFGARETGRILKRESMDMPDIPTGPEASRTNAVRDVSGGQAGLLPVRVQRQIDADLAALDPAGQRAYLEQTRSNSPNAAYYNYVKSILGED